MAIYRYVIRCIFFVPLFFIAGLYPQEQVCFLHVPKTGGLTVTRLLRKQNGRSGRFLKIAVHTPYHSVVSRYVGYKFITFLREPVARVLSEQNFLVNDHHDNPGMKKFLRLPVEGDPIDTSSNNMCKLLSRLDPDDPLIPIEEHLQSAMHVLENEFFFIGITEKFDESIACLFSWLGWEVPDVIPVFHKTLSTPPVYSQEVLAGVAERNQCDIQLYNFAFALFEKQLSRGLPLMSVSENYKP